MPTAFLTASTFEVLPFLGTPGAATVGHTLLWSESPKGFTLSPISVGPDQFSGILPIGKGGTGTSNGSITGTGALTFAAGGTNQNITLQPSGSGVITSSANLTLPTSRIGLGTPAPQAEFHIKSSLIGSVSGPNPSGEPFRFEVSPPVLGGSGAFIAQRMILDRPNTPPGDGISLQFEVKNSDGDRYGICNVAAITEANGASNAVSGRFQVSLKQPNTNDFSDRLRINSNGETILNGAVQSTSSTTGTLRISGGLGMQGNLYVGASGGKINFANLPTASTGLNSGDLWRDSNGFLRVV